MQAGDASLVTRIESDIVRMRYRTGVYSFLALASVFVEVMLALAAAAAAVLYNYEATAILSSVTALYVTTEATLGIRERASNSRNAVLRLTSLLRKAKREHTDEDQLILDEYDELLSHNAGFVDGIFMACLR